ncbi:hypothetical protein FEDK69T_30650 [Flavobacterium enshiense DK69]|uniref:Uncharacterized protein n=1 Tax=Flavobacterium enshiense DK69 TaxID=1107311 RepID=V6S083_9FLAO|nr:hypothetical protein FEDK69T_30650 [Flavobacterium enshiense DK69]KGO93107.1 hypothetical protein Q767_15110 [Flavobacterium enshiense DK69]
MITSVILNRVKDLPFGLNQKIIDDSKKSKITKIFFTSRFGKNNAFRIFYVYILGLKITDDIKKRVK